MRRTRRALSFATLSTLIFYLRLPPLVVPNGEPRVDHGAHQAAPSVHPPDLPLPPPCHDECLWRAGINGTWFQDWEFARDHGQYARWAYPNGPAAEKLDWNFVPTPEAPFHWRTSWRWADRSGCPVDVMTKEALCGVLKRLGASRVLFYGDSQTESMYTAFMNALGDVRAEPNKTGHFACEDGDGGSLTSRRVVKVHCGRDWGGQQGSRQSPRGTYDLDFAARQFVADARHDRMVAVFNIGPHYHNFTHYREDMDKMLGIISGLDRHQDIYFFRATNAGHDRCDTDRTHEVAPLKSYSEYRVDTPHMFDWHMFEAYNFHSREAIHGHNARGRGPPVHFLDIWNMTLLRRDGHRASSDCLHYAAPGPVDWWNHLLFTYLRRLSRGVKAEGEGLLPDIYSGNCRRIRQGYAGGAVLSLQERLTATEEMLQEREEELRWVRGRFRRREKEAFVVLALLVAIIIVLIGVISTR